MSLEPVADGIDRWVMPEAAMNSYVISSAGEALVVDPGTLPSRASALRDAVEARGDRIVGVVITHAHWDHFLALAAFGDVPSYAHSGAVEHIEAHPEEHRAAGVASMTAESEDGTEAELWRMPVPVPGVPVEDEHVLMVGSLRVVLEPLETAHTAGDLVVHVDPVGVTLTGDVVEVGADPQWGPDSDLEGWLRALEGLGERARPMLLPGHGPPTDSSRLDHHRELIVASIPGGAPPQND